MTAVTSSDLSGLHEAVLFSIIDQLSDFEQTGRDQLKPGDVTSLLQDVCIDAKCRISDLPRVLVGIYDEAKLRLNDPHHGSESYSLRGLISSVERAL